MSADHARQHDYAPRSGPREAAALVLGGERIPSFERGSGVTTRPYVGKWNCTDNHVTTGTTTFEKGAALPLHTHNVEEHVLVLRGEAVATIGDERFELDVGDAMWVPAGQGHRVANREHSPLTIFWVYGGREVTRTLCATGETFEVHSDRDRGVTETARD